MRIPKRTDISSWVIDQIKVCNNSLQERSQQYRTYRSLYLTGTPDRSEARFNRIWSHVDNRTSFLYSGETTVFEVDHNGRDPLDDVKAQAFARYIRDKWNDIGADTLTGEAIQWSQVYSSMFVKVLPDKDILIDPFDISVYREDIPYLDDQEIICHTFYQTKAEMWRSLNEWVKKGLIPVSRASDIFLQARTTSVVDNNEPMPPAVQNLIINATTPNVQGAVTPPWRIKGEEIATPWIDTSRIVKGYELWVWDDDANDYRIITMYDPNVVVFNAPNFYMPGEHPFIKYCPNPIYNYFYGVSEVYFYIQLQKANEDRLAGIQKILRKQEDPPTAVEGMMGTMAPDLLEALRRPGGIAPIASPTAKVHQLPPTVGQDLWHDLSVNQEMFAELGGIPPLLKGHGESGVRSAGQAQKLMDAGASRIKKCALHLEDSIERHVNLRTKLIQKYDDTKINFVDLEGNMEQFVPEQFSVPFIVKITSHSASPIFIESLKDDAAFLFDKGIIDGNMLAEIIQFPMLNRIRVYLEAKQRAAAAEAASQEQAMALKAIQGGKAAKGQ